MIVVIAILILLGTAAVLLAYLWYQSPERALMAAISNTAKQQSISFNADYKMNTDALKIDGRMNNGDVAAVADGSVTVKGKKLDINASIVSIGTTMYIKSDNLSGILTAITPATTNNLLTSATDILKQKADGRWVMLEKGQLATYTGNNTSSNCLVDVMQKLSTDDQARTDLAKLYIGNPFIIVNAQSAQGDQATFDISVDVTKYVAFKSQLKRSQLQASLANCNDKTYLITEDQIAGLKIALTVDTKKELITRIDSTASEASIPDLKADLGYEGVDKVAAPADAVTATALQNEVIQGVIGQSSITNRIMSLFGR